MMNNVVELLFYSILSKNLLNEKRVYIIFGPTGTGKTNLAVELAKKIDGEIINCDMAQIYSEIRIGVGQIKEDDKDGILHHLFGFLRKPDLFSVYAMREEIESKIELILGRKKNVLIVGGSSFCVYSLFFAPSLFYKKLGYFNNNELTDNENGSMGSRVIGEKVFEKGIIVDNKGYKDYKDYIVFSPKYYYNVIFFDVSCEERFLWLKNIRSRIDEFLSDGWLEEIEGMNEDWINFVLKKKFIGYVDLIEYIKEKKDNDGLALELEEVKDKIFFKTCQYSKKQRTFLRKMKRDFTKYKVFCIESDGININFIN